MTSRGHSQHSQSIHGSHEDARDSAGTLENTPINDQSRAQPNYSAVDSLRRYLEESSVSEVESRHSTSNGLRNWSWFRSLREQFASLELENKGSVARDHLALERTFLAWLRTSLAFASIGVAITQLFRLNTITLPTDPFTPTTKQPNGDGSIERVSRVGKPLGGTFIAIAILVLLTGFRRYFAGQYWIVRGKFPASRGSITLIAVIAGALIVASLAVILAVSPGVLKA
ncbi:hypothetical protein KEM56_002756 [Ascosphaera pollenicola]|nr:hypothetical protein KEM56_002756 [Ascosphaera pollenicola]